MAKAKQVVRTPANPYQTSTSPDELSPANQVAYEILAGRSDLLPSIERIMNAGLPEDGAVQALNLFRDALSMPGDPHRDPARAIAAATVESEPQA